MSDPTKKSIVINKSFLSGSAGSSSSNAQNKKSKKNTRNLSEEIIKPNKLKKMLLDKINAKRKAEHSSPDSSLSSNSNSKSNNTNTLDISKETKIFSSEFKKSLDFLDSYIGQKKTDRYNQKTKTLKKQNPSSTSPSPSTSLNNDILKSLHSNNITPNIHASRSPNSINQSLPPQGYITQPVQHQHQHRQATQQHNVAHAPAPTPTHAPLHRPQQTPIFQKIELQIPNKPAHHISPNILPNTVPKINLAIGKPANSTFVYTDLPPELQNFTPPVYNISSATESPMALETLPQLPQLDVYNKPIGAIDSREMSKIDYNNSELLDIATSMENDADSMNMIDSSSTSLFPTSTTFSPIKLSDDTPYGCLKDGKKPTFRMYNKTIKNNTRFSADNESNQDSTYSERQTKLKDLKNRHNKKASTISQNGNAENENVENENDESDSNENRNSHSLRKTKIRRRLRKTITKKFKLGKQAGNVVGVWIKNNDTRKNIQKEQGLLKSKQLGEVKKYLVEKNLIKIGSTAPPGVIRNIYEASMLSGEVENIGKGVGLHNFLEDKKAW
jgi:hypothetical protein